MFVQATHTQEDELNPKRDLSSLRAHRPKRNNASARVCFFFRRSRPPFASNRSVFCGGSSTHQATLRWFGARFGFGFEPLPLTPNTHFFWYHVDPLQMGSVFTENGHRFSKKYQLEKGPNRYLGARYGGVCFFFFGGGARGAPDVTPRITRCHPRRSRASPSAWRSSLGRRSRLGKDRRPLPRSLQIPIRPFFRT